MFIGVSAARRTSENPPARNMPIIEFMYCRTTGVAAVRDSSTRDAHGCRCSARRAERIRARTAASQAHERLLERREQQPRLGVGVGRADRGHGDLGGSVDRVPVDAGGDGGDVVVLRDELRLCPLSGPGRTDQDQAHQRRNPS